MATLRVAADMTQQAQKIRTLVWLSRKTDRNVELLYRSGLAMLFVILLLDPSMAQPITNLAGTLLPAYSSIRHLVELEHGHGNEATYSPALTVRCETKDKSCRWLDYWIVFTGTILLESGIDGRTLAWIVPGWWALKLLGIMAFLACIGETDRSHPAGNRTSQAAVGSLFGHWHSAHLLTQTGIAGHPRPSPSCRQ
jgi:hypothetical protein